MKKLLAIVVALLMIGLVPTTASAKESTRDLELSVSRAPVAPDGTTAGAPLDFVVTFADPDPAVDGVGLKKGATITLKLDKAFDMSGNQGSPAPSPVIILQGWPQSPRVPFPYTTDIVGNTIILTMVEDWAVGAFGPGPKAVHLALLDSTNPKRAGRYKVDLAIKPDPGSKKTLRGHDRVKIIHKVRPSVNVISLFSGPPGPPPPFFNPLFQDVALGDSGRQVGMYLWEKGGAAALGVDIKMVSPWLARLVQDNHVVGWVQIRPPKGAFAHSLVSTGPSVEGPAFVTGVPTGILVSQFTPDPAVPGDYKVTFKMKRGNSQTMHYHVAAGKAS